MNNSFQTVKYVVNFRKSRLDLPEVREFATAEAAYNFALHIESNGGITLVTPVKEPVVIRSPKLNFDDGDY